MICPKCNAPEDQLDFWIDNDGYWHWNCFECEHTWKVHQTEMKKDIEKKKEKK
jgi:Zn ribbon nucleic-acid-binding protein